MCILRKHFPFNINYYLLLALMPINPYLPLRGGSWVAIIHVGLNGFQKFELS